jgi:hypothetical protein
MKFETVIGDTPAAMATSRNVTCPRRPITGFARLDSTVADLGAPALAGPCFAAADPAARLDAA